MEHPLRRPLARSKPAAHVAALRRLAREPRVQLAGAIVASRALVVFVAWLAGSMMQPGAARPWNQGSGFFTYFARWDSGFYMDIARTGYGARPEMWAFQPGYPIVLALVHRLAPWLDWPTVGFLVSNVAFAAATLLFYEWTRRLKGDAFALRASLFLCFVPGSFYMSAVYSESLVLLFAVGALFALHERRWAIAGLLAGAAAITRPTGVFLVGALLVAVVVEAWRARRVPWRAAACLPISLALPALFAWYQWARTGDPFVSAHVREAYWPVVRWHTPLGIQFLHAPAPLGRFMLLGVLVAVAVLAYVAWDALARRDVRALPAHAFAAALLGIGLSYAEPNPVWRYLVPVLPLYWLLADASRRPAALGILLGVCGMLLGLVAILFATWWPVY